jgi:hypothetical protein
MLPEPSPGQAAKAEAARQLVILLFAVVTVLVVMAFHQPDLLRTLRMRVAAESRRHLTWLARRAGHTSMGMELRTGSEQYALPMWLSRLRDKAGDVYDRERDH